MTAKTSTASLAQLPVSRKFYNALLVRVDGILSTIFANPSPEYSRLARRMIDSYLRDDLASIPENAIVSEVRIIFLTLKAEIDRAVERSARARARRNTCKRPNRCKPDHNIPAIPPATSSVSSATTPETDLAKSDTIQTIPPVIPTDTQEDTSTSTENHTPANTPLTRRQRHTHLRWRPVTPPRPHTKGNYQSRTVPSSVLSHR